jgi:hypothetical protein
MPATASFPCRFCPRSFKREANLKKHTTSDHKGLLNTVIQELAAAGRIPTVGENVQSFEEFSTTCTTPDDTYPQFEIFPEAGSSIGDCCVPDINAGYSLENPWVPFADAEEYKLIRWFIESGTPKTRIDEFYNNGLAQSAKGHATSATGVWQKIELMDKIGFPRFQERKVDYGIPGSGEGELFYRDPVECVAYLLRQPAFAAQMVWAPVREWASKNKRLYSKMHTADWWWEQQVSKQTK